jgi:alcohol dehydrogenase
MAMGTELVAATELVAGAEVAPPPSGTRSLRPRTRIGHYAALLSPNALTAGRLALDRDVQGRSTRVLEAARALPMPWSDRASGARMRGLIVSPGGGVRWRSIPAPSRPGPDGAIVRPLAVATCDVDRAMMLGRTPFPLPMLLGHECVAEVVEIGARVSSVRVGQRVVVPFQINCGRCGPCTRGHQGNCTSVPPASMYGFGLAGGLWGGTLADLLAVPYADAMLVALPAGVDPVAAASVADNVSDAYRQVAPHLPTLLAGDPDAQVLIVARLSRRDPLTSSTALYAGLIAKALGARNIAVVDSRPAVRDLAERLGLRPLNPRRPREWPTAPLTVDATGTPAGLRQVLRHTAPDGVCTCVWSLHRRVGFPLAASYVRNLTLHVGRSHARALIPEVLALMAAGRLRPELVTTRVASFDDAPSALREHCRDDAIKTILVA